MQAGHSTWATQSCQQNHYKRGQGLQKGRLNSPQHSGAILSVTFRHPLSPIAPLCCLTSCRADKMDTIAFYCLYWSFPEWHPFYYVNHGWILYHLTKPCVCDSHDGERRPEPILHKSNGSRLTKVDTRNTNRIALTCTTCRQ
jgi:hypothetical protein